MMHFYTVQRISGKRSVTPEGFLLIEGVPLARLGMMVYGPDEVPVPPGPDGLVHIDRTAEEVFRPETVASANGKDLVDNHPAQDVCPDTYNTLSLGTLLNPRRGVGIEDDFLIGDVLVKSRKGIELINSGKVELSMGYDADYMTVEPGRGYQKNVIYNHVALVDKGRCGPRCAIGDRQYVMEKDQMSTLTARKSGTSRVLDKLRKALRSNTLDEEMLEETLGDAEAERVEPKIEIHNHHAPAGGTGDEEMTEEEKKEKKTGDAIRKAVGDAMTEVMDTLDKRFKDIEEKIESKGKDAEAEKKEEKKEEEKTEDNEKILGNLELEAPPGTNDKARKSRDSAYLVDSFQETVALAEIIAPGIRIPTFDAAHDPRKSYDTICNLRRTAFDIGYSQAETRGMIDDLGAGNFRTMDCAGLRTAFLAVGAMKKRTNNAARTGDFRPSAGAVAGTKMSIADLNKRNAEHYTGGKK